MPILSLLCQMAAQKRKKHSSTGYKVKNILKYGRKKLKAKQ